MAAIQKSIFSFLNKLKTNNNRDWMMEHKKEYQSNEKILKEFYSSVEASLNITDEISKLIVFRINRDLRFSKDKTPYNIHRSASFSRAGAHRRGGYYLRIEPGKSAMAGGFFSPENHDLLRIRREFEMNHFLLLRPYFDYMSEVLTTDLNGVSLL